MTDPKELGKALKNNEPVIEIEGDLVNKVIRIKATEKGVWAVVIIAITICVASIATAPATGGVSTLSFVATAPAAVTAWGIPTTAAAVAIAVAGGGVAVLEKLRKYRLEKISDKKIILYRK